ncbi:unnamed protein product [Cuscuta epithymum]|uniref:Dihydroneopterin aldolase n=1 Tax=Cuscuta epithymum TaxID=186058 RepID=A0AAV0FNH6_9ASTE|nr:unnamed protein product [Cuscuta epithymum]
MSSDLFLSNSPPNSSLGDKTTIKGLKYHWSNQDIFVDVDTWIFTRVAIPQHPSTDLSRLVEKIVKDGNSYTTLLQIARAVAETALTENDYISAISVSVKVEKPTQAAADSADSWGAEVFRVKPR